MRNNDKALDKFKKQFANTWDEVARAESEVLARAHDLQQEIFKQYGGDGVTQDEAFEAAIADLKAQTKAHAEKVIDINEEIKETYETIAKNYAEYKEETGTNNFKASYPRAPTPSWIPKRDASSSFTAKKYVTPKQIKSEFDKFAIDSTTGEYKEGYGYEKSSKTVNGECVTDHTFKFPTKSEANTFLNDKTKDLVSLSPPSENSPEAAPASAPAPGRS